MRSIYSEALRWRGALVAGGVDTSTGFAQWLRTAPEHVQAWLEVTALDEELSRMLGYAPFGAIVHSVDGPREQTNWARRPRRRKRTALLALCASLLVLLVSSYALERWNTRSVEYSTGIGESRDIALEDGTIV